MCGKMLFVCHRCEELHKNRKVLCKSLGSCMFNALSNSVNGQKFAKKLWYYIATLKNGWWWPSNKPCHLALSLVSLVFPSIVISGLSFPLSSIINWGMSLANHLSPVFNHMLQIDLHLLLHLDIAWFTQPAMSHLFGRLVVSCMAPSKIIHTIHHCSLTTLSLK